MGPGHRFEHVARAVAHQAYYAQATEEFGTLMDHPMQDTTRRRRRSPEYVEFSLQLGVGIQGSERDN
jgi:hypothetical protein